MVCTTCGPNITDLELFTSNFYKQLRHQTLSFAYITKGKYARNFVFGTRVSRLYSLVCALIVNQTTTQQFYIYF